MSEGHRAHRAHDRKSKTTARARTSSSLRRINLLNTRRAILGRGETIRCRLTLMAPAPASVLAINGGSSSIKFAVYRAGTLPTLSLSGTLDRIGRSGTTLSWRAKEGASVEPVRA